MLYIGLDPGKSTGFCMYDSKEKELIYSITVDDFNQDFLFNKLESIERKDVTIIAEEFRVYPNARISMNDMFAPKINGALWLLCKQREWTLVMQFASLAKQWCTDTVLKECGWYKGYSKHERDAMRHLRYYLVNKEGLRL